MSAVLTVDQVRDANLGPLRSAAGGWIAESQFLATLARRYRAEVTEATTRSGWTGPAADAARAAMADDQQWLDAAQREAAALGTALSTAAAEFDAAQRALVQALDDAARLGVTVSSDGGVSWPASERNDPDVASGDLHLKAGELHGRIFDALQKATLADQEAARDITDDLGIREDAFNATAHDGRRADPATILAGYQVKDDPHGTVKYPDPVTAWLLGIDRHKITATEAAMLNGLTVWARKDFMEIEGQAADAASTRFSPVNGENDSHRDAFRHAYWNALMTQRYGEDWTKRYASAHEQLPKNPGDREAMDLYNNEVGRRIAMANPHASDEELARLVEEAVRRGDTVVIPPGGGALAYSDQVADGQTGKSNGRPFDGKGRDPGGVPSELKS
ncbi:hypothetical protein [Kitasatospora sp. NPDC047058]|uniref:DUF6973 domain-containing protein n=1 Tax=Kitasatospora sp. NPDC047058 TaxID=3155620 RepID=UPI0033CE4C1F